jgi:hypothetical protein
VKKKKAGTKNFTKTTEKFFEKEMKIIEKNNRQKKGNQKVNF